MSLRERIEKRKSDYQQRNTDHELEWLLQEIDSSKPISVASQLPTITSDARARLLSEKKPTLEPPKRGTFVGEVWEGRTITDQVAYYQIAERLPINPEGKPDKSKGSQKP